MRIGEFSKLHGISSDTIRYYLDMELLVTEKQSGQYKFKKSDSKDLKRIIELKELHFSLIDIQKILTLQRLSGTNTTQFRKLYISFLEKKQKEVTIELSKYEKIDGSLTEKIKQLKTEEKVNRRKLGVPMGSLSILACPLCKNSLHVSNGVIEDNQIVDADIYCACGYHSTIQDGIYVDEAALREKKLNGEKMPTKEEYMEKASNSFINFMYKGITTLIEQINNYGKETTYIMELNNCVGFFLLQYIRFLPRKSTYILIDYDKERIKQLKIDLEMHYEHDNFIFLCCDIHRLPIARASINVMADFWMTKSYAESTGEFLPDRVLPLLKEDGLFVASFQGIEKNVSSNNKFMSANYLKPDVIVNKLSAHNLKEVNFIETQPIVEDNPYNKDIQGVEIYQAIYAGTKNKQRAAYNKVVRIK